MASFFEDFEKKKKKNRKKVLQIVNPSSAVKTSKETKQATKTKTVTPAAKSYVSKNTKKSFSKDYENRKKVTLPSASNLPSMPSVKTSDGSLRTPIRSIREDRRQVENLAAQRKARAAQLDRQTLYEGDKTLNPVQQRAIQSYKLEWENAKTRGDAAGMAMAHQNRTSAPPDGLFRRSCRRSVHFPGTFGQRQSHAEPERPAGHEAGQAGLRNGIPVG